MRGRRARWWILGLVLLTALALGCSGNKPEAPPQAAAAPAQQAAGGPLFLPGLESKAPEAGGTFTRSLPADAVTLNPIVASDQVSYLVYKWIYDPLIDMDADMKPTGVLAESWETTPDGLVTLFHLRKGVRWHDGAPFTADDVLFSYEASMDPAVDAINKRPAFGAVKAVEKVDEFTVRVRWKGPYAPGLAAWVFYVMPKHLCAYAPGQGKAFNESPLGASPVGTGPFRFKEWRRGERVVLEANADYWRGRPHLDALVFKIIPQSQTQVAGFKTGQVDLAALTAEQWRQAKADPDLQKHAWFLEYLARQFFYLGWNMDGSNPFFADVRVRRAMALAMNRKGLVDSLLEGHGVLGEGPFFPGQWAADPSVKPLPYDPAKASALLDEAGWKDTDGDGVRDKDGKPFAFECLVPAEAEQFARYLEVLQQDLKRVGVDMTIRKIEWQAFLDRTHRHKFQAYLSGWGIGDDPDPFQLLHSSQAKLLPSGYGVGQNDMSYASREVDGLIAMEQGTMDLAGRQKAFYRMHQVLAEDQPITVLYWASNMALLRNSFQNVRVSPTGYGLFGWYPSLLEWWRAEAK